MEGYDNKTIHYGFLFGLPVTHYYLKYSEQFNNATDTTILINSPNTNGFRMGFVLNMYLNDHWDFRTTPTISLYERRVDYEFRKSTKKEIRESTWLEVPLLLKYKSVRRMNSRMYMLAGITLGVETNVRKRTLPNSGRLSTAPYDITIDYGFGLEQFLPYTKFTPEIRFSHGFLNAYRLPEYPLSLGISRLTSHTIGLYIMFE